MPYFKPLLVFILILISGFNIQISKPYLTKWVINKECSLKVVGSTNVNNFSCVIANYYIPDTLTFYKGNPSESLKVTGSLNLDVDNFDCHHPIMTKDLRKTLKAKEFPKLIVRFVSLSRYPNYKNGADAIKGLVTIELAGIVKRFDVNYRLVQNGANALTLIGTRKVNFSDFKIVPPRKLGGMIQTNNELDVEFNLKVKILN